MKLLRGVVALLVVLGAAGCAGSPRDYPMLVEKAEQLLAELFGTVPDEAVESTTSGTREHLPCDDETEGYGTWIEVATVDGFDERAHLDGLAADYADAGWDHDELDAGHRLTHPEGYVADVTAPDDATLHLEVTSPCVPTAF